MATFSHRLYKDEFSKEFIYQLEHDQIDGLMATDESSEKVLVIVGELEILEKLGHIMYCEDEQKIKSITVETFGEEYPEPDKLKDPYGRF